MVSSNACIVFIRECSFGINESSQGVLYVKVYNFPCHMYFVYIAKCLDGSMYTGITTDVTRRLNEHQIGIGSRYTRAKKVTKIVYTEQHQNRSSASKREIEIKSWTRKKKLELIEAR